MKDKIVYRSMEGCPHGLVPSLKLGTEDQVLFLPEFLSDPKIIVHH